MAEPGKAIVDNIKRRMSIACWIITSTNKLSQYVIPTALPLQQFLHELNSILRCTYIDL